MISVCGGHNDPVWEDVSRSLKSVAGKKLCFNSSRAEFPQTRGGGLNTASINGISASAAFIRASHSRWK